MDVGRQGRSADAAVVRDGRRQADFVTTLHQQVLALGATAIGRRKGLIGWLDRHDRSPGTFPAGVVGGVSCGRSMRGLMAKHGITDVSVLALDRFRLRDEVEARIQQHRDNERKAAFQLFLLPEAPLAVSEQRAINFKTMSYEPSWLYEGGFQFKKHYFGPKPGELKEQASSGATTEEFQCAQFIDGLPEVKYWVRNLVKKTNSFRLQTSKDWFYPDFICQLEDGRTLAVEYKGAHLYDAADAEEKRAVGKVWESRSGGRCLFVMPTNGEFSR